MRASELKEKLKGLDCFHPAVLARFLGNQSFDPVGIIILISSNLGRFRAGCLVCFWSDGDITTLDPEHEVDVIQRIMPIEENVNAESS